ncbi:MAG: nucleoside monophosphate kinase [Patescibacteria group bacterium]
MTQKSFIFIGRSGCGKGTQAKMLMEYLKQQDSARDVLYIQTGAEMREFMKGDSYTQKLVKQVLDEGELPEEFIAVYMWSNVLISKFTGNEQLVFDGCPRKFHEAGVMESVFRAYKLQKPYVINLDIDRATSEQRLLARKRYDDNKNEIDRRQAWYERDVAPTVKFYETSPDYTFIKIDGTLPVEKVFEQIVKAIN